MAASEAPQLRVCDFYSGIGGMHHAIKLAGLNADVVSVFEVNNFCNSVYQKAFGIKPITRSIDSLTKKALDGKADLWVLSPPCQPYTRNGNKRDSEDPRAKSFLHLIELLRGFESPPSMLLVENVVGFENSATREKLVAMLAERGYEYQEFHLSPIGFGIPNQRTRYFLLAKRAPLKFSDPSLSGTLNTELPSSPYNKRPCAPISEYLEGQYDDMTEYHVPEAVIRKSGMMLDLRSPTDARTCCFTKGYARYVEGTGSMLTFGSDDPTPIESAEQMVAHRIRYLSPREIANLHVFPAAPAFEFPDSIALRQRYAMLGNSLNVRVVAELLTYLVAEPLEARERSRSRSS